ncbi:aminotransferase class I/II-fold pyridoxal phosphate-dependent enzyme [Amycolatopsis taiwanensis]|uniref:aminotransferase class I/II-fold pyridoxal phosphate-dependent enzyme n=1 Tax=Amycolatopsis taiwanensis TaxID=342230 RepID=UPI000485BC6B|nr:aminotransferase class I/II-fold pyridoxal phosphate-dependent enzyme [Amycolatopsis taiwanensis]
MSDSYQPTTRLRRLEVPERAAIEGASLRELERELERTPAGPEFLDITYADTHRFPPDSWVLDEFVKAASGAGMTYTPYRGDAGVRRAVAEHAGSFLGEKLDGDREIILTPGTQAALYTALSAIVEPGDTVVLPDPDYITSERSVRYLGADIHPVSLLWPAGESPRLDLEALAAGLRKNPKLVMLSHPNNPTGALFDPAHVAEIAALIADSSALLLVDQLYSRLVYDNKPFAHMMSEPGMRARTITTLGPSKTESLSGYRIGLAVAPPEIIDRMEDVMSVAALRCPAYAQHILARWLDDDADYVAKRIGEYQSLRDVSLAALSEMPGVDVRPAGGSAYLFPAFPGIDATDQEVAIALKRDAGLVVNPGYQFGPRGRKHFRICFAQEEKAWDAALNRMAEVLDKFPRV